MIWTNIAISCLFILAIINYLVVGEMGGQIRDLKHDTQCIKSNVWHTQDIIFKGRTNGQAL